MKTIQLTRGLEAIVDDADYEAVTAYKWQSWQAPSGIWYARRTVNQRTLHRKDLWMHREIMRPVEGQMIDHKDGNGLNNIRSNLRLATNSQNQQNRHHLSLNTSGFRGVTWNKASAKWQAQIKHQGKNFYLGVFDNAEVAAAAYNAKAAELFGEFARFNLTELAA